MQAHYHNLLIIMLSMTLLYLLIYKFSSDKLLEMRFRQNYSMIYENSL